MLSTRRSLGSRHRGAPRYGTLRFGVASLVAGAALLATHERLEAPSASWGARSVPVVVAARDVPPGAIIDRNALAIASFAVGTDPVDAFANIDSVANRVTRVAISKGEVVTPGRLAPEINSTGLALKITPGKRAYTIRVNKASTIGGMIRPNSRVDVMVVNVDPDLGQRTAKVFLSNVRVLAVSRSADRAPDGRASTEPVATVEVTPEEAEQLAVGAVQGSLQLVLRGFGDRDIVSTTGAQPDDVFAHPSRSAKSPSRRRTPINKLIPSPTTPRHDSVAPTVFRRSRGDAAQADSSRRPK